MTSSTHQDRVTVLGLGARRGRKLVRRLGDHGMLAYYNPTEDGVNCYVTSYNREQTERNVYLVLDKVS